MFLVSQPAADIIKDVASEPVFSGETLTFLRELKANNNREWFGNRKSIYESAVKAPTLHFASVLSEGIATIAPEYATAPEKAVQRIYRDIRFSPDKTPYRNEIGILFTHRGLGKDSGSGIYVSIGPERVLIAGGLYQQDTRGIYAIRIYLMEHLSDFESILSVKPLRSTFGKLSGASLKRPPRGVPPEHPAIDLLKQTQWLLSSELSPEAVTEPAFLKVVLSRIRMLIPFVRFFEPPLLAKVKPVILD